ncbi:hypothetical protein [Aeromonas salmonicida]|uniref:hypothetical protein n=1 Tax=Aeromonas salmonicida TaxID=645 RepID=UPI003CFFFCD2
MVELVWDAAANGNAGNTVAAAGSQVAATYCSGKRLPTKADLDALRTATAAAQALAKYPKGRPYLITDASGKSFQTYQLATGATANYVAKGTPTPYVMCVTSGDVRYQSMTNPPLYGATNTLVSDGTWQTIGTVYAEGGATGASPTILGTPVNGGTGKLGAANFRLTPAGCQGGTCTLEAKAGANEYGTATAQIANAVYATSTVNVATTFLQNALVTAAAATTDNVKPDGTSANVITLTLKDVKGDPVPAGTKVKLKYGVTSNDGLAPTITPANNGTATVDARGQVTLNIKSKQAGTVTVTNPQVVGGLPPQPMSTAVTFKPRGSSSALSPSDFVLVPGDVSHNGAVGLCLSANARLPHYYELQALFLSATSATKIGEQNDEMKKKYGWTNRFYWSLEYSTSVSIQGTGVGVVNSDSFYYVDMLNGLLDSKIPQSAAVACIPL